MYAISASNEKHFTVLLRVLEEHDVSADSVDKVNFRFQLVRMRWWLYLDLLERKAQVEPPYVP